MLVMTLALREPATDSKWSMEIHLLNPRECFPHFGGSSQGLVPSKTASLVTRERQGWMVSDVEYDIWDPLPWERIAVAVNSGKFAAMVAPFNVVETLPATSVEGAGLAQR